MTTAAELLTAFACSNASCACQKALKRGQGKTHCPGHSDTSPSLDIAELGGKVLFMCHGKCPDHEATLRALQDKGLFKKSEPKPTAKRPAAAMRKQVRYVVRDACGAAIAVHVRQDVAPGDKRLWWELPDGGKGLSGVKTEDLLYGLELLAQRTGEPVVLAEGEKAAEALHAVGVVALATVCGAASTPSMEVLANLAKRRVFLWPDADEAGRKHMERTGTRLHQVGCELLMVDWPEAPPKGDAADCPPDRLVSLISAAARWEPEAPEDGAALLADVATFLSRFVAFPSPEARDAATLWVTHAHGVEHFESTPRLALLSPEKQSGKTRTLEVLELLAPRARHTANLTSAALFRLVTAEQPTILMDEADTYFRAGDQVHEELRGLVNAGHRKGAVAYRCVGQNQEVRAFPAYAALALAGIGDLPDTVLDRAVLVKMRRRAPDEPVEPLRRRQVAPEAAALAARLAKWVEARSAELQEAWPTMPEGLTDRPADCWEPLLAVADVAGGEWPERARRAALKLNDERRKADPSLGVRLLADIRSALNGRDRITTSGLLELLVGMEESPWGDLRGKPLDSRGLARRLKPFAIQPKVIRVGAETPRGYEQADFLDAWKRYLPSLSGNGATSATSATTSSDSVADSPECCASDLQQDTDPQRGFKFEVADVADVAHFPEGGAGSANGHGRVRLEQVGPAEFRLLRPKGSFRCCEGLWVSRDAAAAHAEGHGWEVTE